MFNQITPTRQARTNTQELPTETKAKRPNVNEITRRSVHTPADIAPAADEPRPQILSKRRRRRTRLANRH